MGPILVLLQDHHACVSMSVYWAAAAVAHGSLLIRRTHDQDFAASAFQILFGVHTGHQMTHARLMLCVTEMQLGCRLELSPGSDVKGKGPGMQQLL